MYNKGDKYKNNKTGEIWTVYAFRTDNRTICLEQMSSTQLLHSQWVTEIELMKEYTLLSDNSQLDWFNLGSWNLPKGKDKEYCLHNWKEYHGLNFSDEYCTLCNEKRILEKK